METPTLDRFSNWFVTEALPAFGSWTAAMSEAARAHPEFSLTLLALAIIVGLWGGSLLQFLSGIGVAALSLSALRYAPSELHSQGAGVLGLIILCVMLFREMARRRKYRKQLARIFHLTKENETVKANFDREVKWRLAGQGVDDPAFQPSQDTEPR